MLSWDRMGDRPIRLEEDVHWMRNDFKRCGETYYEKEYDQNRGGYFGYDEEQNQWSRNEEEDDSLKELMKTFFQVQSALDEELELSIKMLNIQVDQNLRNDQATIKELEQKLEWMNERVENQPTGRITNNIQLNPRLSNNQYDQGSRYKTPSHNAKNVNAKDTRSGFNHGNEEEQNGKEKNFFFADLEGAAGQLQKELRGNSKSVAVSFVAQSIATQSNSLLRSNCPEQPRNDPKAYLEVGNHVGDELMVYNEDETLKSTPIPPTRAYEPRKEKSLEMELEELLGTGVGCVVDTSGTNLGDITLDEFERMFDISEEPDLVNEIVVEGEKELEPETEVEDESVRELDGEPCLPLKVDMDLILEFKGILEKPIDFIFILTCLEREEVLQVKNDANEEPLDFDDFLDGKPIRRCFEKDKYGGKVGECRQGGGGAIMRETKEWHDAMAKTRIELDVSNYEVIFNDLISRYFGDWNVLRSWYLEGNWGKSRFPSLFVCLEGGRIGLSTHVENKALYGRQPRFANFHFLLFVFVLVLFLVLVYTFWDYV